MGIKAVTTGGGRAIFTGRWTKNQSGNQTKKSKTGQQNGERSGNGQYGTDWREKFADQFTKDTVVTDTSYTSPNLSIHLSRHQYDTGKSDASDQGKHLQYDTRISYILADVYIGDLACFQTAFTQDTYGVGYTEKLSDMSKRMNAVLGINGDSYSNNRHRENGTIIRNGVTYRDKQSDAETCLLNKDGTMEIVAPGKIDPNKLKKDQVYQGQVINHPYKPEHEVMDGIFLTEGSK